MTTAADPVVIAHVSDLHIGAHSDAAVESVVADVVAAAPAMTIVTGDLTMRARRREFAHATVLLDEFPGPRLVVLGNHDVPLDPWRRLTEPLGPYLRHLPGPLDQIVEVPGVRALGLASMPRWRWKSGRVTQAQADAVQSGWDDVTGVLRVLALHHPPTASGAATIVGRSRLMRSLVLARVDLVLAGHTHVPAAQAVDLAADGRRHRVVEVIAGTATSTRLRDVGRSWSLIRADGSTITVEERHNVGAGWSTAAVHRFGRGP